MELPPPPRKVRRVELVAATHCYVTKRGAICSSGCSGHMLSQLAKRPSGLVARLIEFTCSLHEAGGGSWWVAGVSAVAPAPFIIKLPPSGLAGVSAAASVGSQRAGQASIGGWESGAPPLVLG